MRSSASKAGTIVLDEQLVFDAILTLALLRSRLALRLAIDNLSDAPDQDVLGSPLPGRSYHAELELRWF